jgi:pyrophosphatase PpaX
MFGPIKNIVFDFDGTLVDTMSSVIEGLTEAVRVGSGKVVSKKELVSTFGGSPLSVLGHWMPAEKVNEALQVWIQYENNVGPADMCPFDGVSEMLEKLQGAKIQLGIYTGRDRAGTLKICKAHGWLGKYFAEDKMVCGDDGFPAKPSGKALEYLTRKWEWKPSETLMVGDHPYDMLAGREAGLKVAAALWDISDSGSTRRSKFKEAWKKWDKIDIDLRLDGPLSLTQWLART